jgi:hypothetical protein
MMTNVFSRIGRGALVALGFCCVSFITPAIYELVEYMNERMAERWSTADSHNPMQALMIDPQAIPVETCKGDSCEHRGIKPLTYFVPRSASSVLVHARLILDEPRVYEAPEGGYFTNLNLVGISGWSGVYFNSRNVDEAGERLMDEILPTSEIRPVRLEKEGYFLAWERSDASLDEPAMQWNSTEGRTRLLPTARFRRLTFQPVARVFSAVLTDVQASDVAPHSRIILFTEPTTSLQAVFNSRGMVSATITAVTQGAAGELLASIEPLSNGDRTGIYEHWMTARLDQRSDITRFGKQGLLAIILPPEDAGDDRRSLASEPHQMPRIPLHVVPKSAVDKQCSIDHAPSTGCVWSLIAGEAVAVQVKTIQLSDEEVAVLERELFAGEPIAPAQWRQLSAAVRREWLSSGSEKSVLEGHRVLDVSPKRTR